MAGWPSGLANSLRDLVLGKRGRVCNHFQCCWKNCYKWGFQTSSQRFQHQWVALQDTKHYQGPIPSKLPGLNVVPVPRGYVATSLPYYSRIASFPLLSGTNYEAGRDQRCACPHLPHPHPLASLLLLFWLCLRSTDITELWSLPILRSLI